jgi:hypothetical protein
MGEENVMGRQAWAGRRFRSKNSKARRRNDLPNLSRSMGYFRLLFHKLRRKLVAIDPSTRNFYTKWCNLSHFWEQKYHTMIPLAIV